MRRRKKPGSKEKLLSFKQYVTEHPGAYREHWSDKWFGNNNPIHLELGAGRAKFSVELARQNPDINYIAVEKKEEVILYGVRMAHELGLKNIAFGWFDIQNIEEIFGPGEISQIYLNFSDPWPKNRHYKRRLTYRDFLKKYAAITKPDSWVHFKTDNEVLFEFTLNETADLRLRQREISLDLHGRSGKENIITTDYEEKYIAQGIHIYRMEFDLDTLRE